MNQELQKHLDALDDKKAYVRYCYVVTGTEIDIVGVWSARAEAIGEAIDHMNDSGVTEWEVRDENDEFVAIHPTKYETYEQCNVLRFAIQ